MIPPNVIKTQKTAIINNELLRLWTDIDVLQETRISRLQTLKDEKYTFFLIVKMQVTPESMVLNL